ncbi:MAG: toxin-antitoxin system toxin subunit [Candidatus Riflebacteria bacterium]|nr:toxin-antitoxin system toxin subunit [Candidatus Riflebacteria bacterium]
MNTLAHILCSRVRAEIFRVFFGLRSGELHLREIHRQTGFALGTVRQDVEKLVHLGLLDRRKDGNRVYFSANRKHPLHPDICQLVLKTIGLSDSLAGALQNQAIRLAFVFGSAAEGTLRPDSDIDLMVVGDLSLRKVAELLSSQTSLLGREVNPHVLSPAEFHKRLRAKEHFVSSVLQARKIFLIGTENDLANLG